MLAECGGGHRTYLLVTFEPHGTANLADMSVLLLDFFDYRAKARQILIGGRF